MSGESIGQTALREWLDKEVKLERYFDKFVAHGYGSLAACCNIDDALLDEVGITPPYHRKRLIKFSETLKERLGFPSPSQDPRASTVSDQQILIETGNRDLVSKTDSQSSELIKFEDAEESAGLLEQGRDVAEIESVSETLIKLDGEGQVAPPLPPKVKERERKSSLKSKPLAPTRNASLKNQASLSEVTSSEPTVATNSSGSQNVMQVENAQLPNVNTASSLGVSGDCQGTVRGNLAGMPSHGVLPRKGKAKAPPPIPPRVDLDDENESTKNKSDNMIQLSLEPINNDSATSIKTVSSSTNGCSQVLGEELHSGAQNHEPVVPARTSLSPEDSDSVGSEQPNGTITSNQPKTAPVKPPRKSPSSGQKKAAPPPPSNTVSPEPIPRTSTFGATSVLPAINQDTPSLQGKTPVAPPRHHKKLERTEHDRPHVHSAFPQTDKEYETITPIKISHLAPRAPEPVPNEPTNSSSGKLISVADKNPNLNRHSMLVQRPKPALPTRNIKTTKSLERSNVFPTAPSKPEETHYEILSETNVPPQTVTTGAAVPGESIEPYLVIQAPSKQGVAPVEPVNYEIVGSVMAQKTEPISSHPEVHRSTVEDKTSKGLSLIAFLQEGASSPPEQDDIYEPVETKERGGSVDTLDYESDDSNDDGLEELPALESRSRSVSGTNLENKRVSTMGLPSPKVRKSEGYLYKQGGQQNNKGWKRRWFVFDNKELRYYKEKGDPDSLHVVPVCQMKNVEYIDDPKRARFNLLTSHRVFMLAAESINEIQLWTQTLMEGILIYQKTVGSEKDPTVYKLGGSMCDPDKEGWLKKQGHNMVGDWRKRYVVIKGGRIAYFDTVEDFHFETPICVLDSKLATVKTEGSRSNRFKIVTAYKTYSFQADSEADAALWMECIKEAIQIGLGNMEIAEKIWENLSNKACADCGTKDPKWASVNLLVVVCIRCAGIHRKLGVHYCKVRSLLMDEKIFNPALVKLFVMIGNENANKLLCHKLPDDDKINPDCSRERREEFIYAKYRDKKYSQYHKFFGYSDALGGALRESVVTDDVLGTMELIFNKANLRYVPEGSDCERTPLELAVDAGQELQAELLRQNGADSAEPHTPVDEIFDDSAFHSPELSSPMPQEVYEKEGLLTRKEGVPPTWKKRYFMLKGRQLKYSRGEADKKEAGFIDLRNVTSLVKFPGDNVLALDIITTEKTHNLRMETEEETETWFMALKNKQVFGIQLSYQELGSDGIPHLVAKCLQFVEISGGLEVEGIYRLSGSQLKIRALKQAFNQDAMSVLLSTEDHQVHDVTGTLKLYLRELPEPVIPATSYSRFIDVSRIPDHHLKLQSLKTLIDSLPRVNYDTLKRIIGHLKKVTRFGKVNKMELQNISVIFGPTLMSNEQTGRMNQSSINQEFAVVGDMITFYDWLFSVGDEEKRKEEEMQEAIKKIKDAVQVPTPNNEWTLDIYVKEINDCPCRLKVSSEMTAGEVCLRIVYQKALAPDGNWALFEGLYNGNVERAFYVREKVLSTVMHWGKAGKNNCLIVKENYILSSIEPFGSSITHEGTLQVRDAKRKDWRQSHVSLKEGCLFVDKTKTFLKGGELEEWSLHKLTAYVGVMAEKQTKGIDARCGFTIVVKNEPEDIIRYLCAKDRSEMFRWMAAIIHMKYPEGMWVKDTALFEHCGFSAEARGSLDKESRKAAHPTLTMHLGRQSSMLRPRGSSRHVVNELKIKQQSLKRSGGGQGPFL